MRSWSAFVVALAALASGSALPAGAQAPAGQYAAASVTFPSDGLKLRGVLARRELEKAIKKEGHPVQFVLYPPFEDNGHFLFIRARAYSLFTRDLLTFLNANVRDGVAR